MSEGEASGAGGPPGYTLDDPRINAAEAPYTFFLPTDEELAALAGGDHAKLIFRPAAADRKWGAERMWVLIDRVDGDALEGTLDNDPEDIPDLRHGDRVRFRRFHVIDCAWADDRAAPPPSRPSRRDYLERCMVDACVLRDGLEVHFLYREEPDLAQEGDAHPDSGWRIRGDYRGLTDAEIEARDGDYVALAAVLNVDDSWLHLIDEPVGAAFIRDWESGTFVREQRDLA